MLKIRPFYSLSALCLDSAIEQLVFNSQFLSPLIWSTKFSGSLLAEIGENWTVPEAVRKQIPQEWEPGQLNKKKPGWRWQDPMNQGNGVRIDRGDANSHYPSQQVDHVIVRKDGQVIGRNGQAIAGSIKSNPTEAHIPLQQWLGWKKWYAP